jgi:hypothetical protein
MYPGASWSDEALELPFDIPSDYHSVEPRSYVTDASVAEVDDFYLDEMEAAGWERTVHMPLGDAYRMSGWQKDSGERAVTVVILQSGGETSVAVVLAEGAN